MKITTQLRKPTPPRSQILKLHQISKGQRTQYYIDYKNLYDGLHPDSLIAKLWLRRICQRVVSLCY